MGRRNIPVVMNVTVSHKTKRGMEDQQSHLGVLAMSFHVSQWQPDLLLKLLWDGALRRGEVIQD